MRNVICHYHIFKNSGTSFDLLLKNNFGERHILFDGPFPYFSINQDELSKIIMRNGNAIAFSSHQIKLPQPAALDFKVLAAVFVRHPVLRARSIYNFKKATADGTLTAQMAKSKSFGAWIEYSLNDRLEITIISNAQTRLLGWVYGAKALQRRTRWQMEYDLEQAKRNISNVELLARTEFFDQDVSRFPAICKKYGISFSYEKVEPQNVTTKDHDVDLNDRLEKVRAELGSELYEKLENANRQDVELFETAGEFISGHR